MTSRVPGLPWKWHALWLGLAMHAGGVVGGAIGFARAAHWEGVSLAARDPLFLVGLLALWPSAAFVLALLNPLSAGALLITTVVGAMLVKWRRWLGMLVAALLMGGISWLMMSGWIVGFR